MVGDRRPWDLLGPSPFAAHSYHAAQIGVQMALVKTSPIISDIRGSIGGVCFSRSRHGVTIRRSITPTKGQSNTQSLSRAYYTQAIAYWRTTLTDDQRLAWNAAAQTITFRNRLGDPTQPSGFQVFMRSALNSVAGFHTFHATPPSPLVYQFPLHTISWDEAADEILFESPTNQFAAHTTYIIYSVSPDFPPSVYSPRGPWTYAGVIGFLPNIPFSEQLLPAAVRMRPCRRFYRMRAYTIAGAFSGTETLSIFIPPTP